MVAQDVDEAVKIVDGLEHDPNYARIYYCSNEALDDLFHFFSVKNKDVLSVMGSGDQPFYSLYYGAKTVDTFDINILTKYYYYLRYWSLLYNNIYYPPRSIFKSHEYIYELLQKVKCESEEETEAYNFWNLFIRRAFPFDCGNLYNGSLNNLSLDVNELKDKIKGKKISFSHFDLFDTVPTQKKYDVIITSNILEYAGHDMLKLKRACHNLKSLLNTGGMVVGSHYVRNQYSPFFMDEASVFTQYFDYHDFPCVYDSMLHKYYSVGYQYTLRDVNKK